MLVARLLALPGTRGCVEVGTVVLVTGVVVGTVLVEFTAAKSRQLSFEVFWSISEGTRCIEICSGEIHC